MEIKEIIKNLDYIINKVLKENENIGSFIYGEYENKVIDSFSSSEKIEIIYSDMRNDMKKYINYENLGKYLFLFFKKIKITKEQFRILDKLYIWDERTGSLNTYFLNEKVKEHIKIIRGERLYGTKKDFVEKIKNSLYNITEKHIEKNKEWLLMIWAEAENKVLGNNLSEEKLSLLKNSIFIDYSKYINFDILQEKYFKFFKNLTLNEIWVLLDFKVIECKISSLNEIYRKCWTSKTLAEKFIHKVLEKLMEEINQQNN